MASYVYEETISDLYVPKGPLDSATAAVQVGGRRCGVMVRHGGKAHWRTKSTGSLWQLQPELSEWPFLCQNSAAIFFVAMRLFSEEIFLLEGANVLLHTCIQFIFHSNTYWYYQKAEVCFIHTCRQLMADQRAAPNAMPFHTTQRDEMRGRCVLEVLLCRCFGMRGGKTYSHHVHWLLCEKEASRKIDFCASDKGKETSDDRAQCADTRHWGKVRQHWNGLVVTVKQHVSQKTWFDSALQTETELAIVYDSFVTVGVSTQTLLIVIQ